MPHSQSVVRIVAFGARNAFDRGGSDLRTARLYLAVFVGGWSHFTQFMLRAWREAYWLVSIGTFFGSFSLARRLWLLNIPVSDDLRVQDLAVTLSALLAALSYVDWRLRQFGGVMSPSLRRRAYILGSAIILMLVLEASSGLLGRCLELLLPLRADRSTNYPSWVMLAAGAPFLLYIPLRLIIEPLLIIRLDILGADEPHRNPRIQQDIAPIPFIRIRRQIQTVIAIRPDSQERKWLETTLTLLRDSRKGWEIAEPPQEIHARLDAAPEISTAKARCRDAVRGIIPLMRYVVFRWIAWDRFKAHASNLWNRNRCRANRWVDRCWRYQALPPGPQRLSAVDQFNAIARFAVNRFLLPIDSARIMPLHLVEQDAFVSLPTEREEPSNESEWQRVAKQMLVSLHLHSTQVAIYFILLGLLFWVAAYDPHFHYFHERPKKHLNHFGPFVATVPFVLWTVWALRLRSEQINRLKDWAGRINRQHISFTSPMFWFRWDRYESAAWEELRKEDFFVSLRNFGLDHGRAMDIALALFLVIALAILDKLL